jgi:hypothetical protein
VSVCRPQLSMAPLPAGAPVQFFEPSLKRAASEAPVQTTGLVPRSAARPAGKVRQVWCAG